MKVYFLQNKLVLNGGNKDFIIFILFSTTTPVSSIDLQKTCNNNLVFVGKCQRHWRFNFLKVHIPFLLCAFYVQKAKQYTLMTKNMDILTSLCG